MNLVVIGAGYVGLTSALVYAKLGHRVACVDIDSTRIARLDLGQAPFYEPGLPELLREMQEAGRIVFTTELNQVASDADLFLLAVGTPSDSAGRADLSYLFSAADGIGAVLDHEAIIIVKSTVPVGTNAKVLARVREAMKKAGRGDLAGLVRVASVPEFLREGRAIADFLRPDRLVIGADDDVVYALVERLHEGIPGPRVLLSLESAELAKYAANAFLATKISFINEIAQIAERTGADVREVAKAIGLDPRIGPAFLQAGIGYGGSCFPKDVSALHQLSGENGYAFKLLSAVIETNNHQRELFFGKIESALGSLKGRRIAVWGLAFKGGTDDVRASAAIDIVQRLYGRGADVIVYDALAMENAKRVLPDAIEFAPSAVDATIGAEALIVLTDWVEFRDVSFETVRTSMLEPKIFDGRNLLADLDLGTRGFMYVGVGIGNPKS